MSGSMFSHDYYKILEIPQTADSNSIKASFRRLAKITHPDKNASPTAKSDFQLASVSFSAVVYHYLIPWQLHEAYSVVIDPVQRRVYDIQYATTNFHHTTSPEAKRPTKNTSEASENEIRQDALQLGIKLQHLKYQLLRQQNDLRNMRIRLSTLDGEVLDLQREIENIAREQAEKMTWRGYLSSFLPGRPRETEAQKTRRDLERIEKIAVLRVKENIVKQQKERIQRDENAIKPTIESIRLIETKIRREKDREEQERRKVEEEIIRQKLNRMKEEMKAREENQADKEKHKREDSRKTSQTGNKQNYRTEETCLHQVWWNRVDGRIVCSHCSVCTRNFAFQCPGCAKLACASCREIIKRRKPNWYRRSAANNYNSQYSGFTGDDDYFHSDWY